MFWDALTAISNSLLFLAVAGGLYFTFQQVSAMRKTSASTFGQVSAMKAMGSLDLLIRLDDRLCSQRIQDLILEIKKWDPKNLNDEQNLRVKDIIGIFELVGLAIEKKYIDFDDAEIMFGSALLMIYDDYGYKSYIEKDPLFLNYTKKFAEQVRETRKKRKENAAKLITSK